MYLEYIDEVFRSILLIVVRIEAMVMMVVYIRRSMLYYICGIGMVERESRVFIGRLV